MRKEYKILLLINSSRAYDRGLIHGITQYANINGPWHFYRDAPFYISSSSGNLPDIIRHNKIDGIIMREHPGLNDIIALGIPVIISPYRTKSDTIVNICANDKLIGEWAADYFLKKGYRNFAFLGFKKLFWSVDRFNAFSAALKLKGFGTFALNKDENLLKRYWVREPDNIARWMKTLPTPLALFTATDEMSQLAIEASKIAGIKVPEEIAVLGVDNDELICDLSTPPLSSIDHNPRMAGFMAAKMLHNQITGKKGPLTDIIAQPVRIVTRQSSDATAIDNPDIIKALHFIKQTAPARNITVNQVVSTTSISRRSLEKLFVKFFNKTVHDIITEARINRICDLLLNTGFSISEIAYSMGFNGVDNFSAYFKKVNGVSPSEFRRKNTI